MTGEDLAEGFLNVPPLGFRVWTRWYVRGSIYGVYFIEIIEIMQ